MEHIYELNGPLNGMHLDGLSPASRSATLDRLESSSFIGGFFVRMGQVLCGLTGHDELLRFERARLSLYCPQCGYQSPGWEVDSTRQPEARQFRAQMPSKA